MIIAMLAAAAAASTPVELHLVCRGENDASATHLNLGLGLIGRSGIGGATTSSEHFRTVPEEVPIDIVGTTGTLKLPPRMSGHTLSIVDVKMTEDVLRMKVKFGLGHAWIPIDRHVSTLTLGSGGHSFQGHCEPVDRTNRAF